MLESEFQGALIKEIYDIFDDDVVVLKNDSGYMQGIPDLIVLHRDRYAMLEVKAKKPTKPSDKEPNQDFYVDRFAEWSYGAFIYPENKEVILEELQRSLRAGGKARVSKR